MPLTTRTVCPVFAFAPLPINSDVLPVFEILHEYLPFSPSFSNKASQQCHTVISALVFAAHNRSPSFFSFMSSLRLDLYRALSASRSVLTRLPSPAMTMGLHSVQLASSFYASPLSNIDSLNRRHSGSPTTDEHFLEAWRESHTLLGCRTHGAVFQRLFFQRTSFPTHAGKSTPLFTIRTFRPFSLHSVLSHTGMLRKP